LRGQLARDTGETGRSPHWPRSRWARSARSAFLAVA